VSVRSSLTLGVASSVANDVVMRMRMHNLSYSHLYGAALRQSTLYSEITVLYFEANVLIRPTVSNTMKCFAFGTSMTKFLTHCLRNLVCNTLQDFYLARS